MAAEPVDVVKQNARTSQEYAAVGGRLPFLGGRAREEIEKLPTAILCAISWRPRRSG